MSNEDSGVEQYLDAEEEKFSRSEKFAKLKEIEEGYELVIPTRYKPEALSLDKFNVSVSYTFSSGVRFNNFILENGQTVRFGADDMTYRRLYIILCESFNSGVKFVDTYFDTCFGPHMGRRAKEIANKVKKSYKDHAMNIEAAIAQAKWRKDGEMDQRSKGYRLWFALQTWKPIDVKPDLREFSLAVKDDIKRCLAIGLVPMTFAGHSKYSKVLRERLGFVPLTAFYASGQLVDHITLYFKVALDDDK